MASLLLVLLFCYVHILAYCTRIYVVGDPLADGIRNTNAARAAECIGIPNLDVVPVDLDKQYLPPRNAWVLCDACNKWRRIPAELADFIDETKCTW